MPYQGRNGETSVPIIGRGSKLTPLMERFIDEFMIDFKPAEAVLRAGYKVSKSNANRTAVELRKHPLVKAEIERRMEKKRQNSELTAQYLIDKLTAIIEDTETANPQAALRGIELAGKYLGIWRDKQEISGPDGKAIEIEEKTKEDVRDFRSRIAGLAARNGKGNVSKFPDSGSSSES